MIRHEFAYTNPNKQIAQRKGAETITAPFLLLFIIHPQTAKQQENGRKKDKRQTGLKGRKQDKRQEKGKQKNPTNKA